MPWRGIIPATASSFLKAEVRGTVDLVLMNEVSPAGESEERPCTPGCKAVGDRMESAYLIGSARFVVAQFSVVIFVF